MAHSLGSDIAGWLDEGIAAIMSGDKARGRELLMRVVERDQNVEEAWLWLSRVMESPHDRLIALENVIALNPGSSVAQAGIQRLLSEHPDLQPEQQARPAAHAPDEPEWLSQLDFVGAPQDGEVPSWMRAPGPATLSPAAGPSVSPAAAMFATSSSAPAWKTAAPSAPDAPAVPAEPSGVSAIVEQEDQELACPYCGRPTRVTDTRCFACGKSLILKRRLYEERSSNLQWLVIIALLMAARGLLDLVAPAVLLIGLKLVYGAPDAAHAISGLPAPGAYAGQTGVAALVWGTWILGGVLVARSIAYALFSWGLNERIAPIYYIVVGMVFLDLIWSMIRLVQFGPLSLSVNTAITSGVGIFGVVLNLGALYFTFGAWGDFQIKKERILTRVDLDAKSWLELMRRGRLYRKNGMWGLAAVHFAAALGSNPDSAELARDYAIALTQVNRDEEALKVLRSRQARLASDTQIPQIIALIEEKIAKKKV